MRARDEEFVLGENVTHLAKGKDTRGAAVLSVRISAEELAHIEAIGARRFVPALRKNCGSPPSTS